MNQRRVVAVLVATAISVPHMAWASGASATREPPKEVIVNGLYCVETAEDLWCRDGGKLVKMERRASPGSEATAVSFFLPARDEPDAATRLSAETTRLLGSASMKYSWSGPLKWSAISNGLLGILVLSSDVEGAGTIGGVAIASAALALGAALFIDASAKEDLSRVAGTRLYGPSVFDAYAADEGVGDEDEDEVDDESDEE